MTTFADQAVIAIENVRLFDEVQARTEELSESLRAADRDRQRCSNVISRSPCELQPVLRHDRSKTPCGCARPGSRSFGALTAKPPHRWRTTMTPDTFRTAMAERSDQAWPRQCAGRVRSNGGRSTSTMSQADRNAHLGWQDVGKHPNRAGRSDAQRGASCSASL